MLESMCALATIWCGLWLSTVVQDSTLSRLISGGHLCTITVLLGFLQLGICIWGTKVMQKIALWIAFLLWASVALVLWSTGSFLTIVVFYTTVAIGNGIAFLSSGHYGGGRLT